MTKFTCKKIALCFFISSTLSCKQQTEETADLAALDQFAGANVSYICGGPYTDNSKYSSYINGAMASKEAINETLSALPNPLKQAIFEGGIAVDIVASNNVNQACLNSDIAKEYKGKIPFPSCFIEQNDKIIIYVEENPKSIKSNLIRAIGYFVSEVKNRIEYDISNENVTYFRPMDNIQDKARKDKLSLAFLKDVLAHPKLTLNHFKGKLPAKLINSKSFAEIEANWLQSNEIDTLAVSLFGDYVYAEAFDSYYCSDVSRATITEEFKNVANLFGFNREKAIGLVGQTSKSLSLRGRRMFGRPATRAYSQTTSVSNAGTSTFNNTQYSNTSSQAVNNSNLKNSYQVGGGEYKRRSDGAYTYYRDGVPTGDVARMVGGSWQLSKDNTISSKQKVASNPIEAYDEDTKTAIIQKSVAISKPRETIPTHDPATGRRIVDYVTEYQQRPGVYGGMYTVKVIKEVPRGLTEEEIRKQRARSNMGYSNRVINDPFDLFSP